MFLGFFRVHTKLAAYVSIIKSEKPRRVKTVVFLLLLL